MTKGYIGKTHLLGKLNNDRTYCGMTNRAARGLKVVANINDVDCKSCQVEWSRRYRTDGGPEIPSQKPENLAAYAAVESAGLIPNGNMNGREMMRIRQMAANARLAGNGEIETWIRSMYPEVFRLFIHTDSHDRNVQRLSGLTKDSTNPPICARRECGRWRYIPLAGVRYVPQVFPDGSMIVGAVVA